MSMSKRPDERQGEMWIPVHSLSRSVAHPFYERLNRLAAGQDDRMTGVKTLEQAAGNIEVSGVEGKSRGDYALSVVADKGYHSDETLQKMESTGLRTYVSEPNRDRRRNWTC
jgi:hypothetical protein